jgi:hypothetical protein
MSEGLTGYDGAVNGMKILHGVAVASQRAMGLPAQQGGVSKSEVLPPYQPQQEVAIESAIRRAIEVIGDREEAMRWLGTPVRALEFATPISCLHDPVGREQVLSILINLEHGVL